MRFGPEGYVQQLPTTDEPDAAGFKLIEEIGVDECWAVFQALFASEASVMSRSPRTLYCHGAGRLNQPDQTSSL
jgi:hypothetical protein